MTDKTPLFPMLVADIGGTNARFGIVGGEKCKNGRFIIEHQKVYSCAAYDSFEKVFDTYLQTLNCKPAYASLAVAGPVVNDTISMTNLSWRFSISSLCKQFSISEIKVINDFGALAYATIGLQNHELDLLYPANTELVNFNCAPRIVLGPGTGLGVAGLIKTENNWQPICGEGGHVSFAPLNDFEVELRNALLDINSYQSHLPIEALISGPGLINIYLALCHINKQKAQSLTPSDISSKARNQSDEQCIATLKIFSQVLGSIAGDNALTMGAFGGVYLSGGILPKIIDILDRDLLIERFLNKGVQRHVLENIPIYLVTADMPALAGAAHWMHDTY